MKNVALIAVAKNESPYLAEWIHHHLKMGFSQIHIGVNRTNDSSYDILSKISSRIDCVKSYSLDWADKINAGFNDSIQRIGYSYLSTKIDRNIVDYIMYLDIDEFWFGANGEMISEFIYSNDYFDIASFNWLCQFGEEEEFSPPFKNVYYNNSEIVKSMIHVSLLDRIEIFSEHIPRLSINDAKKIIHIDQLGEIIPYSNNHNRIKIPINKKFKYGILHRMMRSEIEYVSIVFRGRPSGDMIKSNGRSGYSIATEKLPNVFDVEYYISLEHFIKDMGIFNLLITSREHKKKFYLKTLYSMSSKQLIDELKNAIVALNNTTVLNTYVTRLLDITNSADELRDSAIRLENIDLKLALLLMEKAHILRPQGPFILEKLLKYRSDFRNDVRS